jgi:antitoxin ParD1/3/4
MAKDASILLGEYFEGFINKQVKTGKYASASEVVRAALRLFENEESKKIALIKELKKGEKSGFIENFDRTDFLETLQKKHIKANEV